MAGVLAATPWWNIPMDQADSAGMLAHLHAWFVDGDLLYDDEYRRLGMSGLFAFVTREGVVSNHWPAGATLFQAPGYLLGVWAAEVLEASGGFGPRVGDSLGVVPLLGVRAAAALWFVTWVAMLWRWLTPTLGRRGAVIAIVGVTVGTPALYYVFEAPLRPHFYAAFVVTGFARVASQPSPKPSWERVWVLGALAGLATAIRPQLAPMLWWVAVEAWRCPRRARALVVGAVGFFAFASIVPRMYLWFYGADAFEGSTAPPSRHLVSFLFSSYHGVFTWCPVFAVGFACVLYAALRRLPGAIGWALFLLAQIWIDAGQQAITPFSVLGTRTWAGGVSFGPRKLLDVAPIVLAVAVALVPRLSARAKSVLGWAVLATSTVTGCLHLAAFLDPGRTTGTIQDFSGFFGLFTIGTPSALREALSLRTLPWGVTAIVSAGVCGAVLVVGGLAWGVWVRGGRCPDDFERSAETRLRGWCVGLGGLALAWHLGLSWLVMRSEAALEASPRRMVEAAEHLTPRHLATVAEVPSAARELRRILGPSAADDPDAAR